MNVGASTDAIDPSLILEKGGILTNLRPKSKMLGEGSKIRVGRMPWEQQRWRGKQVGWDQLAHDTAVHVSAPHRVQTIRSRS